MRGRALHSRAENVSVVRHRPRLRSSSIVVAPSGWPVTSFSLLLLDGVAPAGLERLWQDEPTMGFLKRLFGGSSETSPDEPPAAPPTPAEIDAEERAHELELARGEQDRLSDLQQRQLKYEEYAWEPPPQGGTRRADDEDAATEQP
jgi:hypothetical protein